MPDDRWRLPAAYLHVRSIGRTALAWEFLRRNRVFQVLNPLAGILEGAGAPDAGQSIDEQEATPRRWGLLSFPSD